ncbi:hypothetical protein CH251_22000 [Rhodococcus sp. 06-462-5]|nr:hypothetical protein CH251_22000 [Rhodococcus sp. 06-462-5]OZE68809.1 hypothetical protein CH270_03290 [Rhodococcus sp. 02-925g]
MGNVVTEVVVAVHKYGDFIDESTQRRGVDVDSVVVLPTPISVYEKAGWIGTDVTQVDPTSGRVERRLFRMLDGEKVAR